jgi:hypothetical protein
MADATTSTETVVQTTVTLTMSLDEAVVVHALVSRAEELDPDHLLQNGAASVYRALADIVADATSYGRVDSAYNSIRLTEPGAW